MYKCTYKTPEAFSDLIMNSDGKFLTGLWFAGSRDERKHVTDHPEDADLPVFRETARWLDEYFAGNDPVFMPRYRLEGLTEFRRAVVEELLEIPFGEITTYGEIAERIARRRGLASMSAQAVGGAVGWNPVCLIIPCHRVIGADGSMTGYSGGIDNKQALLMHERYGGI